MDFGERIKWILGERAKHPWGRALGIGQTRVQAMLDGHLPKVDALQPLQMAEHVSLDWLISGIGNPYRPPVYGSDQEAAAALRAFLEEHRGTRPVVLRAPGGVVAVVAHGFVTRNEAEDLEVGELFVPSGPATLGVVVSRDDGALVEVAADTVRQLVAGEIGAAQLLGPKGILGRATPMDHATARHIAEEQARYEVKPTDEARLVSHYRHLPPTQRGALLEVIRAMDRTVDVLQRPPGGVLDPDRLQAERHPVSVDHETATPDKVGADHEPGSGR